MRVAVSLRLLGELFDEAVALCDAAPAQHIPRRHHAAALARLAPFPGNVSICIDLFQAGAQVLGAFVVENSGPVAAWNMATRNRYLGELDAIFHILVHREIEALCEMCLGSDASDDVAAPQVAPTPPQSFTLSDEVFLRN